DDDSFGNFSSSCIDSVRLSCSFFSGSIVPYVCRFATAVFLRHNGPVNLSARGIMGGLFRAVSLPNHFPLNPSCRRDILSMFAIVFLNRLFPHLPRSSYLFHTVTRLLGHKFRRGSGMRRFFVHLTSLDLLARLAPRVQVLLTRVEVFLTIRCFFLARIH